MSKFTCRLLASQLLVRSIAILFITLANPVFARTWNVDPSGIGDFLLIQAAITAAQAGDTVLVAPGEYLENIRFAGRDIVLKSTGGPGQTTIDGSSQPRAVVEFQMGESNDCTIEGFTITGGSGSGVFPGERNGGGIWMQDAEPTISGNIIESNTATEGTIVGLGGGIYCRASFPDQDQPLRSPRIIGNVIRSNTAEANGGGIGFQEKVSGVIVDNDIVGNTTILGDGGGMWIATRHHPQTKIEGNRINNNDASDHGGGIYAGNAFHGFSAPMQILIKGNVVSRNIARARARAEDSGGGIWLNCTDAQVISNTIVANQGQGPGNGFGGGISVQELGNPLIEKNIIALTVQGGGVLCHDGVQPTIRNNLLWSNDGGDARGSCIGWVDVDGNLSGDPLFCGAANQDYSLPPNSPAFTHPAGPLGATPVSGCASGVLVIPTTWTRIKIHPRFTR